MRSLCGIGMLFVRRRAGVRRNLAQPAGAGPLAALPVRLRFIRHAHGQRPAGRELRLESSLISEDAP
jgi:hypothetical protein